jgi:hypothetical protein
MKIPVLSIILLALFCANLHAVQTSYPVEVISMYTDSESDPGIRIACPEGYALTMELPYSKDEFFRLQEDGKPWTATFKCQERIRNGQVREGHNK